MAPGPIQHRRAYAMPMWQTGDIAYLKSADYFNTKDYESLIQSGYMPYMATNHPVIILKRHSCTSRYVLVTPVSAYSSGEFNNYLPPWKQQAHALKYPHYFRSFLGSERVNNRKPLYLEDGKNLPKPKTSWVNIQSVWVVPLSVLGVFTKSLDGLLRVRKDSLNDLTMHMASCCRYWSQRISDPRLADESMPPASHQTWRQHPPAVSTTIARAKDIRLAPARPTIAAPQSTATTTKHANGIWTGQTRCAKRSFDPSRHWPARGTHSIGPV